MWNEFKEFAFKGNVIDMAVGVIIGGAFSKIVTSLVGDILMPILGAITGGINFTDMKFVISNAILENGEPAAIAYGSFIQNIIDFLIIAVCIFGMVKVVSKVTARMKKEEEPAPEEPKGPTQEELLAEIRDLLKEQK
ncbi:MAG: large-conductance mechanosensitive channel protein MscL [Oliverpabstia sp.]